MFCLYHFPLCPFSRLARILLIEKQLVFKLIEEKPWERSVNLLRLNPAADVPVLIAENSSISSIYAICEYLEDLDTPISFLRNSNIENAEIRRIMHWTYYKLYNEVTRYIIDEKIIAYYNNLSPRVNYIRAARENLTHHLKYFEFLLKTRKWLAGNSLTLADLSAATHLSSLDYLGEINWDNFPLLKEWYSVLKSRPSFRALLVDRMRGFTPPPYYQNLDF